jgi:hypothetical protein
MTDSDGRTLLHEAAADRYWRDFGGSKPKEHLAMWNRLLMLGISINTRDRNGRSPLFEAVTEEMTTWMLQQKADVNLKDDKGMTALMAAAGAEGGHSDGILRLLIKAGGGCDGERPRRQYRARPRRPQGIMGGHGRVTGSWRGT